MTVLGTRPEIIRLSLIIGLLDRYSDHILVDTGQNYHERLSGLFFRELGVREPDLHLKVRGEGFADQVSQVLSRIEPVLREHRPDRLLILGDTNSGLSSIVARRMGIPVYHMEAGNRCGDFRVPEEMNRKIIDHISNVLMPYTNRSRENLLREGIDPSNIFVTGNPIKEVLDHYAPKVDASNALQDLGLQEKKYFLVTMHRAENVDSEERLRHLLDGLVDIYNEFRYPIICSLHPHTRDKAEAFGIDLKHAGLRFTEPLGFFDFVRLEKAAYCLISDSGTVQEEACIFGVPTVTIRDVTERPETIECGSNVLTGCDPKIMLQMVRMVTEQKTGWAPPPEYVVDQVAATVARIVLGFRISEASENSVMPQNSISRAAS
jgi:UDP-N-acetylglucosamine 2-epimerase (non-hydrolysing)